MEVGYNVRGRVRLGARTRGPWWESISRVVGEPDLAVVRVVGGGDPGDVPRPRKSFWRCSSTPGGGGWDPPNRASARV